jgi:hypothetical protein
MKLQRFLDRFSASASFSAFRRVVACAPPGTVQGLVPLSMLGVVCTARLRGLQNLFGMLAGHGLSQLVQMPTEPAGYLMVPAVLLYFAVIASAGWAVDSTLQRLDDRAPELTDALSTVFEQYISLFATTRALAVFQGSGQQNALCVLSLVYLLLPTPLAPSVGSLTTTNSSGSSSSTWLRHLVHCVQNLAARGGMLGVGMQLTLWTGGGEGLLVLYLLAIFGTAQIAPPKKDKAKNNTTTSDKLQDCHTMLSVLCAQHLVGLLSASFVMQTQQQQQQWLSISVLAVCVVAVAVAASAQRFTRDEHMFADVCAFGISLLMTGRLEQWLEGSAPIEAVSTYLCVFALLECVRSDYWSGDAATLIVVAQGGAGAGLELDESNIMVLW